jgi:rubrerythrin
MRKVVKRVSRPVTRRVVRRKTSNFCTDVAKAIVDESAAIVFYRQIVQEAPTLRAKQIVRQIRQDEISHRALFRSLRNSLCR